MSKASAGVAVDVGFGHIRFEQVQGAWNEIAKIKDGAERKDSAEVRGWLS